MKFEIQTISQRKVALIALFAIPAVMFFSVGLASLFSNAYFVYLLIPLLGLTIFLGSRLSKSLTIIDLGESEYMRINEQEILYKSIVGYFVNDGGLTQTAFCLRLDSEKTIQIVSSSVGNAGEKFIEIQNEIIRTLESKILDVKELEYADVYVKQMNFLRPFIYISIGVIIIIDFIVMYMVLKDQIDFPWRVIFLNSLIIFLLRFLKKGNLKEN